MKAITRKILIVSGKGGVGKSSVAAGLSMALGSMGNKVGILDLDICGPSVPKLLCVEGEDILSTQFGWRPLKSPHYDVKVMSIGSLLEKGGEDKREGVERSSQAVVWRGPRKTELIKRFMKETFWGRMDYLMFDTPPGTSDEHLTVVKALINAHPDGALIVTTPQEVALATIRKEIDFCRKMGLKVLGLVANMSGYQCPCCLEHWSLFSHSGVAKLAKDYHLPLLGSIPLDPIFVQCCEKGQSIFKESPDSPAAQALMEIANQVHSRAYEIT